jgi:hypothetical protein
MRGGQDRDPAAAIPGMAQAVGDVLDSADRQRGCRFRRRQGFFRVVLIVLVVFGGGR